MPSEVKFRLDVGVQQTLKAVLPALADQIPTWQDEVAQGEISEQFRQVAVALGWITQRDSRVRSVGGRPTPSAVRAGSGQRALLDDNELLPADGGTMATVESVPEQSVSPTRQSSKTSPSSK